MVHFCMFTQCLCGLFLLGQFGFLQLWSHLCAFSLFISLFDNCLIETLLELLLTCGFWPTDDTLEAIDWDELLDDGCSSSSES